MVSLPTFSNRRLPALILKRARKKSLDNKMNCTQQVVIPNAKVLYEAPIDVRLTKRFAQEHNVQLVFIDTERGLPLPREISKGGSASRRFFLCYNLEHACVLIRERNALLLFDSLQFTELSKFIRDRYKGDLPLLFADETGFTHSAVQEDSSSACLAISIVYIVLRCEEEIDHGTAISKLKRLRHYQIRELAFALLGLLDNA